MLVQVLKPNQRRTAGFQVTEKGTQYFTTLQLILQSEGSRSNRSAKIDIGKTLYWLAKRNETCSYIVQYVIIKY